MREILSSPAVARNMYKACHIDDVSRGSKSCFFMLVKIVRCDVLYHTVDFGAPSLFNVDFNVLFLRTNSVRTYQKV
jgi:hypothetical protein